LALWLPRYYHDSIEAKSTGTEGDRNFTGRVTIMLTRSSFVRKNQKEKKRKQEVEEAKGDEDQDKT